MQDVLIVAIVMLVPISAIVGSMFLRYRKMELDRLHPAGKTDSHMQELSAEMLRELKVLRSTNEDLVKRVQKLEYSLGQGQTSQVFGEVGAKDSY